MRRTAGTVTLVVGALLAGVAWLFVRRGLPDAYRLTVEMLPLLLAVLAVALGLRFRRSRLVSSALVVAAADFLLTGPLAQGGRGAVLGGALVGVLLPLDLAILALLADRGVTSGRGAAQALLGPLELIAGAAVLGVVPLGPVLGPERLAVAWQAAWAALLLGGLVVALAYLVRRRALDAAILWALLFSSQAVGNPGDVAASVAVFMTAAQLLFLVGFVEDAYRLAYHDELTGLEGRRALNEALRGLREPFAVAMADIDHFKRFNDRYGHEAGDQVLQMVAEELARVGAGGKAYRYGGEEFAVLFPGTTRETAATALEVVRSAIAGRAFILRGPDRPRRKPKDPPRRRRRVGQSSSVTISIGVAGPSPRRATPGEVLKAADRALYRAKRAGRNRIVTAQR